MAELVAPSVAEDGYAHIKWNRESRMIRFYLWLYNANPNSINTCKLFWAYVFALPVLLVAVVLRVFGRPLVRLAEKSAAKRASEPPKPRTGPSKGERFLDATGEKAGAVWVKIKKPATVLGKILVGAYVLWIVGLLIYTAVTNPMTALAAVGILVVVALVICIVVAIGKYIDNRTERRGGIPFFRTIKRLAVGFHRHTCAKVDLD